MENLKIITESSYKLPESNYKLPQYRITEIKKLYAVFCDKHCNNFDLEYRKKHFIRIVKLKFSWFNIYECKEVYKIIKENELNLLINNKKILIEEKYKKKLIKLFCKIDSNDNNTLDLDEFKFIMLKFNFYTIEQIYEMFKDADLNGDNVISIDEFITFLAKNDNLEEKLTGILECKFEFKKKHDKRTIIFNDFPGSPLKFNWRPSLSNLNSLDEISKNL